MGLLFSEFNFFSDWKSDVGIKLLLTDYKIFEIKNSEWKIKINDLVCAIIGYNSCC